MRQRINEDIGAAVDDRRHGDVTHMAKDMYPFEIYVISDQ